MSMPRSPRLLIFGINYAPEETGIAVNTTGIAEGLAQAGWDVTAITGIPHYPAWRRGRVPAADPREPVRVIHRAHYVPRRPSTARRAVYEGSWLASCLPELTRRREVDLVLGVVPSLSGGVLAALAARRCGVPYVLMFQDLMGRAAEQSRFKGARSVSRAVSKMELQLARHAARVAVVADGFRPYLIGGGVPPERIGRVRNPVRMDPPNRERRKTRESLRWQPDEFIVLHSGNMGFKQALENVIRVAELARREHQIRFVLQGDGNQRERLERLSAQRGLTNVSFLPLAPAGEFPNIVAAADLLLVNQGRDVRDMSLPAKITCYFAVGLPVLAAVAADSETGREVSFSEGGIVVEPEKPEALLEAIRCLAADRGRRERLGAAGRRFAVRELRPEQTVRQMVEHLELAMAGRTARHRATVEIDRP